MEVKKWWVELNDQGPKYGYYPKAAKTVLIVKNPDLMENAREIFGGTGVTIALEGERHLGAVIGNISFKTKYVENKIQKWVKDVEELSVIAKTEPQVALSAYTKALCMRWCFVQRTISDISHLFEPLEDAIRDKFIPAVVGRTVSDIERQILALPVRFGGIGVQNPVKTADIEHSNSVRITETLKNIICNQERNFENFNEELVREIINLTKQEKEN